MSNWQPTEQGLSDLLQLLREALNPTDSQIVQEVGHDPVCGVQVGARC